MKAVFFCDGKVAVREAPLPEAGQGELLVRVRSCGINAADVSQLAGRYTLPSHVDPDRPGLELCGEVVACGPGVTDFAVGDVVMALTLDKAQAEYAAVHEAVTMPLPAGVEPRIAGGIPEAWVTAHDALFTQMEMTVGERVLIHGAAGGVGTAAVQLAVHSGCVVFASVRNEALRPKLADLGANAIDPENIDRYAPYDGILETIGAPKMSANLEALNVGGRICVIGVTGGSVAEINLRTLMSRRARISASTLRARTLAERTRAVARARKAIEALFADGRATMPVEASFPLEHADEAYARFAKGGKFGKVMLVVEQ